METPVVKWRAPRGGPLVSKRDWDEVRKALELPPGQDLGLLEQAFCHGSYVREEGLPPLTSNQRLEFLGDAVLDMVLAFELYEQNPVLAEGQLTKLKASLVRAETLYKIATRLGLGDYVLLGCGEEESGGRRKPSILGDCLEALIAAIYLSCGWETVYGFVTEVFSSLIEQMNAGELTYDHKTCLQELLQANGGRLPTYVTVETLGPPHKRTFVIEVRFNGEVLGSGQGGSKQEAEQNAAAEALAKQDQWLPALGSAGQT
jgi:ribonuclease III